MALNPFNEMMKGATIEPTRAIIEAMKRMENIRLSLISETIIIHMKSPVPTPMFLTTVGNNSPAYK